jgi:hypothetical protein
MAPDRCPSIALSLPTELVIEICQTYLEDIPVQTVYCRLKAHNNLESLINIINVSQVCRGWRHVITNCPDLWRHFIDPHHPNIQWTQLLLERSKQADITYISSSPLLIGEESELFNEVAHADRLMSYAVALHFDCQIWNDPNMPNCWPRLQFLCLAHMEEVVIGEGDTADFELQEQNSLLTPRFPSNISTPRLEKLHLHGCTFRAASQITGLQNLKELCVTGVCLWAVPQWVDVIQQLPHLRHLELVKAIMSTAWDEKEPIRACDLELDGFHLLDERSTCASFLQYCNITTSSFFQLECLDEVLSDAEDETQLIYDGSLSDNGESLSDAQIQVSYIYRRITPIVHTFLTTNPTFSNCALRINSGKIQCRGLPNNTPLDGSPWPEKLHCPGDEPPDGGWITIALQNIDPSYFSRMFKQFFQPIFKHVVSLIIACDDTDDFLKEDIWLSELLWESNIGLRQLEGLPFEAWTMMHRGLMERMGRSAD